MAARLGLVRAAAEAGAETVETRTAMMPNAGAGPALATAVAGTGPG